MSLRASTRVWESSKAKGGSLLVLLAIADYAADNGRDAFPSTYTLAWKSRLTQRQVRDILTTLQAANELLVEWGDDGRRYLHLRCVFEDWPRIDKPPREWTERRSAKIAEPRRKSPRGLTPSGPETRKKSPSPRQSTSEPRKPTAGDPLSDPSSEQEQAAPSSPPPVEAVESVEINVGLIVKVMHEVLDEHTHDGLEPSVNQADVERDVETLCKARRIPATRADVRRAFNAAWASRRGRRQPGARP